MMLNIEQCSSCWQNCKTYQSQNT